MKTMRSSFEPFQFDMAMPVNRLTLLRCKVETQILLEARPGVHRHERDPGHHLARGEGDRVDDEVQAPQGGDGAVHPTSVARNIQAAFSWKPR